MYSTQQLCTARQHVSFDFLSLRKVTSMFNVDLKPHNHISGLPNSSKGEIPCLFSFCPNFFSVLFFYRPEGKVMFSHASVILSTIGLMAAGSLLILVMERSVCILLECLLAYHKNNIYSTAITQQRHTQTQWRIGGRTSFCCFPFWKK